mgnify:CR=1 FL=1
MHGYQVSLLTTEPLNSLLLQTVLNRAIDLVLVLGELLLLCLILGESLLLFVGQINLL